MKVFFILCVILVLLHLRAANGTRCVNMWDDGCVNGQISGSGRDDEFVNGDFNPGKRCVNMWDEGCVNGQLVGSGRDDEFVNGGFNPGKRCVNMWDEGCVNGQLIGSGRDDDFVNGGFNPGKRCVGQSCNSQNLGQRRTKINNRLAYFLTKNFKNNHI